LSFSPPAFKPLVRNPHLATILGNFWPRKIDEAKYPATVQTYCTDPKTTIVVFEHRPSTTPKGNIVLLHGLEGSSQAGYFQSFGQTALERGYQIHRANLRTCGGTEHLCDTMYHSGLTFDTRVILERLKAESGRPLFLVGFSLGGNVALKLAGELGDRHLLDGVCAVSTPIDLAACVRKLDEPSNLLYSRRFLKRLRERVARKSELAPGFYRTQGLRDVKTIWEFDDYYTAPLFGFQDASDYYATQSASRYLEAIRTPTLVIAAKDDPLVPFEMYSHPAFRTNPNLQLVTSPYGGHLGFLSRQKPRFWVDLVCLDWFDGLLMQTKSAGVGFRA
jgi:uncharacterized protein